MSSEERTEFTTLMPPYAEVRALLPVFEGLRKTDITSLISQIMSRTGTPQQTLDWSNPNDWINERLDRTVAQIAEQIWTGTNGDVNPRYIRGHYYFIARHHLLDVDRDGRYVKTQRTEAFLRGGEEIIRLLDELEGLQQLLGIIASLEPVSVAALRNEWSTFVTTRSNYRADSAIKSLLRYRLKNLEARGLIIRERGWISLTKSGRAYTLTRASDGTRTIDERQQLMRSISTYNNAQRERLKERLTRVDPYEFEYLVRDLLEEMGYKDVQVTAQSGDQGVDVVARVEFGITTITEVVQVKRRTRTLGRPVVDQLRGALPYHGAIQGTIITLGRFSTGCAEAALFPGASPITLIDGERFLDLLVKHQVGVTSRPVSLHEVADSYFALAKEEERFEADDDPIADHEGL